MRRARANTTVQTNDLLGFELGGVRYAISIDLVREITRPLDLIPVPQGPSEVMGLADYRDHVLAVLDLRRSLGFEPATDHRSHKWIVASHEGQLMALVVDGVTDVFSSDGQSPRSVPESNQQRGVAHAYKNRDELVFVLDLARLAEPLSMVDVSEVLKESARP